jgi:hypothetical protein
MLGVFKVANVYENILEITETELTNFTTTLPVMAEGWQFL